MAVEWKPKDRPTLIAVLPGGRKLIEFVKRAFDAKVAHVYEGPGGAVAHAELRFGESLLMTADTMGEMTIPPGAINVYVPDCDAAHRRAIEAGAKSTQAPTDQFYGDRTARVVDPFGTAWSIATHVEDVSEDELLKRMQKLMPSG